MKAKTPYCLVVVLGIFLSSARVTGGTELKFNTQMFEPFNYDVGGVVSGPTADIIKRVCGEMKITCTFNLL
ncbi:MAG: hypothetical protein ACREP5_04220, partial [Candidatus Binatia bacterium]